VTASPQTFVIVGGGQAGAWIARTLRADGFAGRVVLIGEEHHWPYERPPLSKSVLLGSAGVDEGVLLTEAQAHDLSIDMRLGRQVRRIDRERRRVELDNDVVVAFDILFLATGSRPRLLAHADSLDPAAVHYLRTRNDADRLKKVLGPGRRLAILGGGWIGLEAAASARTLGAEVTVLETASRVCARSAPPVVSTYLNALHDAHGVIVRTEVQLADLAHVGDEIHLNLTNGAVVKADNLLIGIGALPNVELAQACGLAVDNGVLVDAGGRTSDPAIFAAGDVTNHFNGFCGFRVRLESFANAQNQGVVAARAALGQSVEYDEVPWLWSDQYGQNLQIVGLPDRAATILSKGRPAAGEGTWLMLNGQGSLIGAIAVNDPRELRVVRKAMQSGAPIDLAAWSKRAA
jgi:3-phenylpropionate/trans-cinnamate dioxygenase ferredoxin reductase subunit